jgi:hypothetical protein
MFRPGYRQSGQGNVNKKFLEELLVYIPLIRQGTHRKPQNCGEYRHTDNKMIS